MTRARNMADIVSGNFSIPSGALSNAVPADGSITTLKLAAGAVTTAKIAADAVTSATIADDAVTADAIAAGAVPDATASGTIVPWGGSSSPTGWLECDGAAVSRTTYADLFTAIGTTYGSGDGSTTFNVPDIRGRTAVGKDNMGGSAANRITSANTVDGTALGQTGGAEVHTIQVAEMPAHRHRHETLDGSTNDYLAGSQANYGIEYTSNNGGPSTTSVGSGNAHSNIQPLIVLNYIIKT